MISDKFTNIPIEQDTILLYKKQKKVGGYDVRYPNFFRPKNTCCKI